MGRTTRTKPSSGSWRTTNPSPTCRGSCEARKRSLEERLLNVYFTRRPAARCLAQVRFSWGGNVEEMESLGRRRTALALETYIPYTYTHAVQTRTVYSLNTGTG